MTDRCGSHFGYRDHDRDGTETCNPCRDAQSAWQRNYEKRRYLAGGPMLIDGTGTRRRMQGLAALGWSRSSLSGRIGTALSHTGELAYAKRVRRDTAERVAAVYDELSMTVGPSPVTAKDAKRKGWLPPLMWDEENIDDPAAHPSRMTETHRPFDDVAVQRAMHGDALHLRPPERAEAVRRLTAQGVSAKEIAARLRTTKRTVSRNRATPKKAA